MPHSPLMQWNKSIFSLKYLLEFLIMFSDEKNHTYLCGSLAKGKSGSLLQIKVFMSISSVLTEQVESVEQPVVRALPR